MEPYFETLLDDDEIHQKEFCMALSPGAERMEYQRKKGDAPNKGQRKLFLAKLLFL